MRYPILRSPGVRAGLFFFNFFLVITTLYQLKPASRSLYIEYMGSARLPYVWIAVALSMGLFIWLYHRLVARLSRQHVVMGSVLVFGITLLVFRVWFFYPGKVAAIAFYVFVDILGVVLVEQFWSLVNSVYSTREGKSWYGFVGTGGLLGGVTGGGVSALLIRYTPMKTDDLLISAAITLFIVLTLTVIMGRCGLFCEVDETKTGNRAGRKPAGYRFQALSDSDCGNFTAFSTDIAHYRISVHEHGRIDLYRRRGAYGVSIAVFQLAEYGLHRRQHSDNTVG